jgi:hypothetical protein
MSNCINVRRSLVYSTIIEVTKSYWIAQVCTKVETATHVWRCQQEGAMEEWVKSLARLELEMGRLHIDQAIMRVMLHQLHVWKRRKLM